jgi:hypothetical protein
LFINPVGGKRRAPIIYRKLCQPLFSLAGVRTHAIFTRNANHAYRLLRNPSVDLSSYQAIGCVGGDGMFSEILNGILKRQPKPTKSRLAKRFSSVESPDHTSPSAVPTMLRQQSSRAESVAQQLNSSSPSKATARRARPKLLPFTAKHVRLAARNSLPSQPASAPVTVNYRTGKRHSLPTSPQFVPFQSPTNVALPPLLLVPAGSTDAVSYATNAVNDPQTVLINFILGTC